MSLYQQFHFHHKLFNLFKMKHIKEPNRLYERSINGKKVLKRQQQNQTHNNKIS